MQGLNIAVLDGATAIAPFAYGVLADSHGIVVCLWTATAISIVAAVINSPLIFNARLRKSPDEGGKNDAEVTSRASYLAAEHSDSSSLASDISGGGIVYDC